MSDARAAFVAAAARSDRTFWLDGPDRCVVGALEPDDVSLTFDAGRRVVLRHRGGRSEPVGDDIFEVLGAEVAADRGDPSVLWVGLLGYGCRTDLPGRVDPDVPDAVWLRAPAGRHTTWAASHPPTRTPPGTPSGPVVTAAERDVPGWYAEAYAEVQRQLRRGNSYEVNLTYRERVVSAVDPVRAYLRLREPTPAPQAGYLRHRDLHLLSSSPERYARVDADRVLEARPIKGTTPRGRTPDEDERQRVRLGTDPKYRAENLMIVDLLRNDLSMVCEPGTVSVPGLMEVESYPAVHQLVSTVTGRLRGDVDTVGALRALFPAGSMTGAPKRRTMEVIDAVEPTPRGVYAGAFGWVRGDGRADLGVVIRSLVATPAGEGRWGYVLGTGGGVTVGSTLEEEWLETRWKAARLRAALLGE